MSGHLHLDTHVVVWLYAGEHDRFPGTLRDRLNSDSLRISPMVRLELAYLCEIGRLVHPPDRIIGELSRAVGLSEDAQPFGRVIDVAERTAFTRDPFDRIIIAQAVAANSTLATKDERMRTAFPQYTVWGAPG